MRDIRFLEWIPFAVIAIAALSFSWCTLRPKPDEPSFPIRVIDFRIEPSEVRPGQMVTFVNGFCSSADEPILAEFYVGAQSTESDPLLTTKIDLFGKPTPEGRERRTIAPGCHRQEPIASRFPTAFPPGSYRLIAEIVVPEARGAANRHVFQSPVFTVIEAQ